MIPAAALLAKAVGIEAGLEVVVGLDEPPVWVDPPVVVSVSVALEVSVAVLVLVLVRREVELEPLGLCVSNGHRWGSSRVVDKPHGRAGQRDADGGGDG
jgi:hypothetical protein